MKPSTRPERTATTNRTDLVPSLAAGLRAGVLMRVPRILCCSHWLAPHRLLCPPPVAVGPVYGSRKMPVLLGDFMIDLGPAIGTSVRLEQLLGFPETSNTFRTATPPSATRRSGDSTRLWTWPPPAGWTVSPQ